MCASVSVLCCAVGVCCVSRADIMTMMTVAGPSGARGAEWWRMTQTWALMAHRQWVMTAHPSQSSTLHYLYGERPGTKAGRAALSLPSNDICSWRQPHYRSSFTSLSLHLSPSMVIFLAPFLSPFLSVSVTLSAEGTRRSDNEIMTHPFQPFKSGGLCLSLSLSLSVLRVLSFLIPSLSIFSYSLVLTCLRGGPALMPHEETASLVELVNCFTGRWDPLPRRHPTVTWL